MGAIHIASYAADAIGFFEGVDYFGRCDRRARFASGGQRGDDRVFRGARPRAVLDGNKLTIRIHRRQAVAHGILTFLAAFHKAMRFGWRELFGQRLKFRAGIFANDEHHFINFRMPIKPPPCVADHGQSRDFEKQFIRAHASAASGGDDDG